jgi:hypothetical protein
MRKILLFLRTACAVVCVCFVLCSCPSCGSHPAYPQTNANEVQWKQDYRDGKINWEQYQSKLDAEKKK